MTTTTYLKANKAYLCLFVLQVFVCVCILFACLIDRFVNMSFCTPFCTLSGCQPHSTSDSLHFPPHSHSFNSLHTLFTLFTRTTCRYQCSPHSHSFNSLHTLFTLFSSYSYSLRSRHYLQWLHVDLNTRSAKNAQVRNLMTAQHHRLLRAPNSQLGL